MTAASIDRSRRDELAAAGNDVDRVLAGLGLLDGAQRQSRGYLVRCPAHADRTPSCSVRAIEGALLAKCHGCAWDGDVFDLVAVVRGLDVDRDFRKVLDELAALLGIDSGAAGLPPRRPARVLRSVPSPPNPPPAAAEVMALWERCSPPTYTGVDPPPAVLAVARYFARRGWWPPAVAALGCARVLVSTDSLPSWWPSSWVDGWPLLVAAYRADGVLSSVQGVAVELGRDPKKRWPAGRASSGLIFAGNPAARALLGGNPPPDLTGAVVCEGSTDTIATAHAVSDLGRPLAVLGCASGGFSALARVRWPDVPIFVATDPDPAGERYAAEIGAALRGRDLRRVRLDRVRP